MQCSDSPKGTRIAGIKGIVRDTHSYKPRRNRSNDAATRTGSGRKNYHNRAPLIHNIDAVVRWIPVMGHPCFELGFIEDINVPHEPMYMRYPYPIRHKETKNIVRITPKYYEDYIKIVLDRQTCNLHRIYLTTLQPIYAVGMVVDHIDRDTHNNLMSNLRWSTVSENNRNKASRRKYFRTIDATELPTDLIPVEGTNALLSINDDIYNEDTTDSNPDGAYARRDILSSRDIYVYTPIGKKGSVKEYREFDASLNTVEVAIRPSGELKIMYNPKIARTNDGLYISASQVLYKARIPWDMIQRIKERRRLLKSPEYAAKIKQLIEQRAYIKGDSARNGFIFDFADISSA